MTDQSKRPLKVFLCHAHPDADKVRAMYARLKADGVDAWLDKENIIPGQDWELEIRKAVRESDIVVVCLSKQFSQKGYRQNEVRIALDEASLQPEGEIFIIPARLEECNYLESLKRFHGVDLFEERGYEYLMRALRLRADKIGAVLQTKKGWLGGLTSPTKKPNTQKPKPAVKPQPTPEPEEPKPVIAQKPPRKWNKQVALLIVVSLAIFVPSILFALLPEWIPFHLVTVTPTNTTTFTSPQLTLIKVSSTSTFTPVSPTKTEMSTLAPTVTQQPTEITDEKGVKMVFVPEGDAIIGADPVEACKDSAYKDWCEENMKNNPPRTVFIDSFFIDKYEVTNSSYKKCAKEGICNAPSDTKLTSVDYYNNSYYDNYPVVWAYIDMAKQYCAWRGARLPTGSEWEKAARGTDGRTYPWGNFLDDTPRANFCDIGASCWWRGTWKINDGFVLTSPVDSFSAGTSPYGVYNMAGNVSEWVSDSGNFDNWETGYFMGGSWFDSDEYLKVYLKYESGNYRGYDHGFRCARDATP
jgi:formylglycine-generating enzyme required for sulfatase activity